MSNEAGIILVVSAPSGTGKTTICREVLKASPSLNYSVSFTTRPMRPGEVNGRDYHFISEADFRQKIEAGDFAEWTEKFDCLYGTSVGAIRNVLSGGTDLLLDIDTVGARNIKRVFPEGIFIFILPPSMDELRQRLLKRGSESEETLRIRLGKATDEINDVFLYDYVVINKEVDKAIEQVRAIYLAEKNRRDRKLPEIKRIFSLEGKENHGENNG